jgi:hypothetical protein
LWILKLHAERFSAGSTIVRADRGDRGAAELAYVYAQEDAKNLS